MCSTRPLSSNSTVFAILLSSRFWWFISLDYKASLGMISSLVTFSELHRDLQRFGMRLVDLLISKKAMIHALLLYRSSLHIRRARNSYLQQQSECYLHPGWKGPRFRHQQHRYRTRARGPCMMRGQQVNRRPTSSSFRMMMQMWRVLDLG